MEANQKHFKAGIYQLTDGSLRRFVSFYPLEVHDLMVFVVDYNTCETGQTFSSHFRLLNVVELTYETPNAFGLKRDLYERWAKLNAMVDELKRIRAGMKPLHVHKNLHRSEDGTGGRPPS